MSINWKLKVQLAKKHNIYSATEFRKVIKKKTGVIISLSNLCMYLNKKPQRVTLETLEIFCTALDCTLDEFFTISPKKIPKNLKERKLSFKNTPKKTIALKSFPEPENYED